MLLMTRTRYGVIMTYNYNITNTFQNVTVGSPIIQIKATDADTGLNGEVYYRIKQDLAGHWRSFRIDEKTGVISLELSLDRETQKLYEVRKNLNLLTHLTSFFLIARVTKRGICDYICDDFYYRYESRRTTWVPQRL